MSDPSKIAQTILARLGELRAGKLPEDRRAMQLEQLEALARAYLARAGGIDDSLAASGPVYVSLDAARAYGAVERVHNDETARRELTVLVASAKPLAEPGAWRARRRSTDLDVSLRVATEPTTHGPLMVVTHASVRPRNSGGRRG